MPIKSITVKIKCNNAAFNNHSYSETARILRELANKIDAGDVYQGEKLRLCDINGYTCGHGLIL